MKRIVAVVMLLLLLGSWPVAAKTELNDKDKISADSPFYFLDRTGERINYFFAGKQKKVKLKFLYAYERLLETRDLLEKEKTEKATDLFKEATQEFTEGVKLATKYTLESDEVKEIKQKVKDSLNEIRKTMTGEQIDDFTNNLKNLFGN